MLYWAVDESRKITVKKYKSGPCKYFVHVPVTLSCCSSGVWGAARRQFAPCQHTSSSERGWEWQPAGKKEDAWLKFPICLLSHVSLQVWVCMQVYNMSVLIALWHADWNNMLTRKQQKKPEGLWRTECCNNMSPVPRFNPPWHHPCLIYTFH